MHGKKIEAFCKVDKTILCIDCILSENHKNHEIASVHDAAIAEKALVFEIFNNSKDLEQMLINSQSDVRKAVVDLNTSVGKARNQVTSIYSEIYAKIKVSYPFLDTYLLRSVRVNLRKILLQC